MSVGQRSLGRLPLHVFGVKKGDAHSHDVDCEDENDDDSSIGCDVFDQAAANLRAEISSRLLAVSSKAGASGGEGDVIDRTATVGILLRIPPAALTRILDPLLTYDECRRLIENVSIQCAPLPTSALSLLNIQRDQSSQNQIPSLLTALDQHLKGGIRLGTITELVGHASAGKTQFAMQLAVSAALLGLGTIFIDAEQKLSIARLQAIALERLAISHTDSPQRRHHPDSMLANVTVHSPQSSDELMSVLSSLEDEILARGDGSRYPVKLIVLDSIAAPTRRDFGSGSAPQRAAVVIQSAQILKRLADDYQLAVLVINQVGSTYDHTRWSDAVPDNKTHSDCTIPEAMTTTVSAVQAALGTSWHHCVNSRIQLETMPMPHRQLQPVDPSLAAVPFSGNRSVPEPDLIVRRCSVVKSNVVAPAQFSFAVTNVGIIDVPEPEEFG